MQVKKHTGGSLVRYFSAAFVGIHGESKPTSLKEKHSFDLMFLMVVKMFSPRKYMHLNRYLLDCVNMGGSMNTHKS